MVATLQRTLSKSHPKSFAQFLNGDSDDGSGTGRGKAAGGFGFFILFIIIALIINSCLSSNPAAKVAFPTHGNPWPPRASVNVVLAPVLTRLQACAQAPVLAPVNCPQAKSDIYASAAADVHWSLHGDAAQGARVVYWKKAFDIAGSAIMEVTYSDAYGSNLAVQVVHCRASERWLDGRPILSSIRGVGGSAVPIIRKSRPDVAWTSLQEAVRSAFNQCVAAKSAPPPPQCPSDPNSAISGSDPRWRLVSDPLLNASESFDPATGLIHVTGSYAMKVTYDVVLFGRQSASQAGNYDAMISIDGSRIDVLQIVAS